MGYVWSRDTYAKALKLGMSAAERCHARTVTQRLMMTIAAKRRACRPRWRVCMQDYQ